MRALRGVGAPLIKFAIFAVITLLCTALLAGTNLQPTRRGHCELQRQVHRRDRVNKGDEVRIAGVRVGEVADVSLVDRKVALVTSP